MKSKIFSILVSFVLMSALSVTSYAERVMTEIPETEPQESTPINGETILDVLTNRAQEQKLQETFLNPEAVTDDLKGYSLEGKPVLLFVTKIMRYYDLEDPVNMLTEVWENGEYALISLYVVETSIDDEGTIRLAYNPPNPSFPLWDPEYAGKTRKHDQVDIRPFHKVTLSGSAEQVFLGEAHKINNVIFIGDYIATNPPCAVYFTDGGVFVRVCVGNPESYPEYTWHDFAELRNAYLDYLTEISRDKDGNLLVGVSGDFLEYIDNIYPTMSKENAQPMDNGNTQPLPEESSHTWVYILVTGVFTCAVVSVVINRKRKLSMHAPDELSKD